MYEGIILQMLEPVQRLYDLAERGDYIRNQDILRTFEFQNVISIADLAVLFKARERYSLKFDAKRAGECMHWGIANDVIGQFQRDGITHFRLLEREPLYVLIGPTNNRRQVRTRRWRSTEEEKHALRELKREKGRIERARLKEIKRLKVEAQAWLSEILARDIEVEIKGALVDYAAPGVTKLVEIQNYLLQLIEDLDIDAARAIVFTLNHRYERVRKQPLPAPPIPEEDLDVLGDFA